MKKFLFVLSLAALMGCSNDDDSTSIDSQFDPPQWLQGVWGHAATESSEEMPVYTITSSDICEHDEPACWNEYLNSQPSPYTAFDDSTDLFYGAGYEIEDTAERKTINFQKMSSTQVRVYNLEFDVTLEKLD